MTANATEIILSTKHKVINDRNTVIRQLITNGKIPVLPFEVASLRLVLQIIIFCDIIEQ